MTCAAIYCEGGATAENAYGFLGTNDSKGGIEKDVAKDFGQNQQRVAHPQLENHTHFHRQWRKFSR